MKAQKTENVAVQRQESKPAVEMTRDLPVSTPATDIYEYPDRVVVRCDMPGVTAGDVDVGLENDVLSLTGAVHTPDPAGFEPLYRGFQSAVFHRAFTLTADVDRSRIEAQIRNGVLAVTLPKAAHAQLRKIAVKTG